MKYRIKRAYTKKRSEQLPKPFTALARNEEIDLFGEFDKEQKSKRTPFSARLRATFERMRSKWISIQEKRRPPIALRVLLRALAIVLSVALLTALVVVYSVFGFVGASYKTLRVPDLIGLNESDALAKESDSFEYRIKYEYNPTKAAGSVISQSPAPNVERKLYSRDGRLSVTLTVNTATPSTAMQSAIGMTRRDALLMLRNAGIEVALIEEWSDTVPAGVVSYCSFEDGERLELGQNVLIKVSRGKRIPLVRVPELCGLGETEALERLSLSGLLVGEIKYAPSDSPLGRVIAQEFSGGTEIEEGTRVSLTVSGGENFG